MDKGGAVLVYHLSRREIEAIEKAANKGGARHVEVRLKPGGEWAIFEVKSERVNPKENSDAPVQRVRE